MKTYVEPEEVGRMEKVTNNLRDKLLIRLLFRLGCRVSKALTLTVEDVDLGRRILIPRSGLERLLDEARNTQLRGAHDPIVES